MIARAASSEKELGRAGYALQYTGVVRPSNILLAGTEAQRERYRHRLRQLQELLSKLGYPCALPAGAFYLWVPVPDGDAWAAARDLAAKVGIVVSPGEFYGHSSSAFFRPASARAFSSTSASLTAAPSRRLLSSAASMNAKISSVSSAPTGGWPVRKNLQTCASSG